MEHSFKQDLSRLFEACLTFPKKEERRNSPLPEIKRVDPSTREVLRRASTALPQDSPVLGSHASHLTTVIACLKEDLASDFHSQDVKLKVYQERVDAERLLRECILEPQVVQLIGTTGSGKSTLIGKVIHDNGHLFVYLNLARETFSVLDNLRATEHPYYSQHDLKPLEKAKLDENLSDLLLEKFCEAIEEERPVKKYTPREVIEYIKNSKVAKKIVILVDDIDVLPIFHQQAVVQFVIALNRALRVAVVFAQRESNASKLSRLVVEGAGADPTIPIVITPTGIESECLHALTSNDFLSILLRRFSKLATLSEADQYFRKWHKAAYENLFSNGLKDFTNVKYTHISYLVKECELLESCNFSVRFAMLTVGNLISGILIGEIEAIEPMELFSANPSISIKLKLRDALLDELMRPSTGSPPMPTVLGFEDGIEESPMMCVSPELRFLELLRSWEINMQDGNDTIQPVPYVSLNECMLALFPDLEQDRLNQIYTTLTTKPHYGDPLCIRTPIDRIEDAEFVLMPSGRYYVDKFCTYVDIIARHNSIVTGRRLSPDANSKVDMAFGAVSKMTRDWYDLDISRINALSRNFPPTRRLQRLHYIKRALASMSAYVDSLPDTFISEERRHSHLELVYKLRHRIK